MKKLHLLAIAVFISFCSYATIGPITGTNSVCLGNTTTLSNATTGGTWSCVSVIAVVDASGIVTGTSEGTATVTYTVGTDMATTVVTVNANPGEIIQSSSAVCEGSTGYLYTWVPGGTWASSDLSVCTFTSGGSFSSASAGTASVTYTLSAGCSISRILTVYPTPAPITGSTGVCVGSTTTLSDATPGGSWLTSAYYIATVGSATGIVSGVAAGTGGVYYRMPTGCYVTATVSVASATATIGGGTSLCIGVPTTLTFAAGGGTWNSSAPSIANISSTSGVVTGMLPGTSVITYTTGGCAPVTTTVTVTSAIPAITGNMVVCRYGTSTLANAMGGGTWNSSDPSIAAVGPATGVMSNVSAGTATISYTAGSCGTATAIVTAAAAVPDMAVGAGFICGAGTITLSNTLPGGTWSTYGPSMATVGSATGIVTGTPGSQPGYAFFNYTLPSGCRTNGSIRVYPAPQQLVGCDNVAVGDTITFPIPWGATWSSSSSAIAMVGGGGFKGISVGTATLTIYSPYVGCVEALKTISVTSTALVKPITGFNVICANGSTTLSDAIPGGVWSSSDPAVMTIGASSGIVSGVSGGRGLIIYTHGSGSCTREYFINAIPTPIAGPTAVCLHEAITLTSDYNVSPKWAFANSNYSEFNDCHTDVSYAWGYSPLPVIFDCGYTVSGAAFTSSDVSIASITYGGLLTGINAGTATISYTDALHCSAITTVTVNPASVGPITGSLAACIGTTTTLSNSVSGGTWSSDNIAVASVGSSTGVVTGAAAGVANITYTNGSTCGRVFAQVTISPVPGAIAGTPAGMCVGSTATLTNAVGGGTWSSSASSIVSVVPATGVVTAAGAGSAVITYTLGPCGNYTTTTITVNSTFPVTGVANICNGSTTTLSNAGGAGTWTSGDASVATVGSSTGIVTAMAAGTATITFSSALCAASTRIVTVYPIGPITGPANVCIGTSAIMGNAVPGGTWAVAYTNATIDAGGMITAITAGISPITYTLPTGCRAYRTVTLSTSPATQTVTGGGAYCTGGLGLPVGLAYSVPGVSYQLYSGATTAGAPLSGTYGPLNFGLQTGPASYYVIATSASTSCSIAMTGTVTVTAATSVPPVTGIPIACVGGAAALLSDSMAGGTWTSSNTAIATVSASYGYAYGVAPGTATISYITPSCGTATIVVSVNDVPPAITGTTSICQGQTTTLSIATSGGIWSSSNPAVASVGMSTGVVTGLVGGYAYITYTAAGGCSRSVLVIVNFVPSITGTPAMCVGGTSSLTGGAYGGAWSSSASSIVSVTSSGSISGGALGTAVITYTSPGGCSGTHTVTVTSSCSGMPTAGIVSAGATGICSGSPVSLSLTGGTVACGISYQWQSSADGVTWVSIPGGTNTAYTVYPYSTTYYRSAVNCVYSGLTAYSSPASVAVSYAIASHSVVPGPDTACNNAHFRLGTCSFASTLSVTTYYGDGSSDNVPLTYSSGFGADVFHNYTLPGTYSVKQVLYDGTAPQDSIIFTYEHLFCRTLPIKFYQDMNTNCVFDAGDNYNATPVTIAIDSNGVTIDSITVTSGMYRKAYGPPGTVYAFRVIAVSGGRIVGCPSSAVLYDTISATVYTYPAKYFGLQCGTSTSFDLAETVTTTCGTTVATSTIYIGNSYCTPASPVVTMHMSPRYHYVTASPAPVSVSGNTIVWDLPSVSSAGVPFRMITVTFVPTVTLVPGDTIHSDYQVTPLTGDVNTANNYIALVNTVVMSYDPNDLEVSPAGRVLPCAQLQYRVRFENTGNDTARNIYVLDTLSPNLDPASLNAVMASATMNISVINDGVRNIARFDFPNIDLLDSSHHNECHGMFVFSIKARSGLAFGTVISNRVGIYFDDNAAVNTNTVTNTIGLDTIAGPGTVCTGSTITLTNATTGGTWSVAGSGATVSAGGVSGVSAGTATISYTVTTNCGPFTATKVITIDPAPSSLSVSGTLTVCMGSTTGLTATVSGGTWSSGSTAIADVGTSGVVSGLAAGTATISYAVANACGTNSTMKVVTVNALPLVAPVTGSGTACVGATTGLSDATGGGMWTSTNTVIASVSSSGLVSGLAAGTTTISYTLVGGCGSVAATRVLTVNSAPSVAAITGTTLICPGGTSTLSNATPGGTWLSTTTGVATVGAGGIVHGVAAGYAAISYTVNNGCGAASATAIVAVSASASAPVSGTLSVCAGAATSLSTSLSGGTWASSNTLVTTIDPATGLATGVAPGTATITYTHTNGCRSTAVTTVAIAPAAIAGPGLACTGTTITLTNTTAGGTWSTGGAAIASIGSASGIVIGVAAGTAIVSYTLPGGCASTVVLAVSANAMPAATVVVTPATAICEGTPVSLSATITYGGSAPILAWLVNGTIVGSGTTYSYTPAPADNVICRLVSNIQCRLADTVLSAPAAMEVNPLYHPVVTISTDPGLYVFPGQSVTLSALVVDGGPAPQYQWFLNGAIISGATSVSYTATFADKDSVTCRITGTAGCGSPGDKSVVVHVFPLSAGSINANGNISIYPNPTTGILVIRGNAPGTLEEEIVLEVTDVLGQVVYKQSIISNNGIINEQVQLSNSLANGMYMLNLKTSAGSKVFHFVLEQ